MVQEARAIRLSKPVFEDRASILSAIKEVLDSGFLIQGKYVSEFEKSVAMYMGCSHAIAVSSGTAALHLSLMTMGIGRGDEVIVPDFTFPATSNVVELTEAKPILVDVDSRTYNIDTAKLKGTVSDRTKCLIPVHLFGNPANMGEILDLSKERNITIIEDAAGAMGAKYAGRKCGTIGHLGCLSFHPRKLVTTGEGGMILTDDDDIADQVRSLRNHGIVRNEGRTDFKSAGLNYRMTEIAAILGLEQMKRIDRTIKEKDDLLKAYAEGFRDNPNVCLQSHPKEAEQALQALVVKLGRKSTVEMIRWMASFGIETTVGAYALHLLAYYRQKYGYSELEFPTSAHLHKMTLALPFYDGLSSDQVDSIVRTLSKGLDS